MINFLILDVLPLIWVAIVAYAATRGLIWHIQMKRIARIRKQNIDELNALESDYQIKGFSI